METVSLKINGMSCQHCSKYVSNLLEGVDGVEHCEVNLGSGIVKVGFDPATTGGEQLAEVIKDSHYEFVGFA